MPKPKYKIAFVFDDSLDKPDGVQQYILTLGTWLAGQGHEVHYLTGQTERTDIPNLHSLSQNLHVRFNGNRMAIPLPTSKHKLRELLQREKYDILHVQAPFSPWLAGRIIQAVSPQTVVVATFHVLPQSRLVTMASHLLGIWTKSAWRRFDAIFSVSGAASEFARRTFGVESTVLPNVVDTDRFAQATPRRLGSDRAALQVLFLGRLVPRKGCSVLLQAINLLAHDNSVPPFELTVCGKGPLLDSLQEYVRRNSLGEKVHFAGFVSEADKPGYYAGADIAVFPSSGGESFGIVLVEAMASGRSAVLAGDNPGYRSVVEPEQLFSAREPAALSALLKLYLTDASQREQTATHGRQLAAQYDTSIVGATLVKHYQSLSDAKKVQ